MTQLILRDQPFFNPFFSEFPLPFFKMHLVVRFYAKLRSYSTLFVCQSEAAAKSNNQYVPRGRG